MFLVGFFTLLLAGDPGLDPGYSVDDLVAKAEQETQAALESRGNPKEARAHFLAAAHLFEDVYRNGHRNVACMRNEGNAALVGGDLPLAILCYRRGLRLAPNDKVMRSNLVFARDQVDYPGTGLLGRPPQDAWPAGIPRPTLNWLLLPAALFYAGACLAVTRWWMTRQARFIYLAVFSTVMLAAVTGGMIWIYQMDREETQHPLVIISENGVLLRTGNGLTYPPRFETPLNRGVEARLLFKRGSWMQIELAGGETGWVNRDYLLVDESR
jgi:tetratricopeptide (TPR) repeat protein